MNHSIWYLKSCSLLLNLGEMITPFPTARQRSEVSGYEVVNHETKVSSLWCLLRLFSTSVFSPVLEFTLVVVLFEMFSVRS